MGKVRILKLTKSERLAKSSGIKRSNNGPIKPSSSIPSTIGTFNVPLNLSGSGKIVKKKSALSRSGGAAGQGNSLKPKKNVTFRPNLTDVLAAGQVLDRTEKQKLKFDSKNKIKAKSSTTSAAVSALLSTCTDLKGQMKKIMKAHIPAKKERFKLKKESFQRKIESLKKSRKEEQAAKRRKQTVIVGDMKPMLEALEIDIAEAATAPTSGDLQQKLKPIPKKNKLTMKKRQQEIADGLAYFAQRLGGSTSSPFEKMTA